MHTRIIGIPVDRIDYQEAVQRVGIWILEKHRPSAFVTQTNVNSIVTAQDSSTYRQVLCSADLSLPDGMPLVWLVQRRTKKTVGRVYGPDLMLSLCEEAARRGWRCFLYGGKPGVAERLKERLQMMYPGLQVVGTYSPPFRDLTPQEDAEVCRMINSLAPDILWVSLGSPKQDIWMYEHRNKLDVSVMHGVGAAFDFLSGQVRQAPRWMMNAGLEWLFRLFQEPRRLWKRYTVNNVLFLYYLFREFLGVRRPEKRGIN